MASRSSLAVIIVDDIRATRALLKGLLRSLGVENVSEAGDGTEAMAILDRQQKDLIITDLSMAPMNGIELTRRLRRRNSLNAFVPVLMISAHNERCRIKEAMAAGVSAFLLKPVTPISLERKLNALIAQPLPVVRSAAYCGPDRRRNAIRVYKERREGRPDGTAAEVPPAKLVGAASTRPDPNETTWSI